MSSSSSSSSSSSQQRRPAALAAPAVLADVAALVDHDRILEAVTLLRQRLREEGEGEEEQSSAGRLAAQADALGVTVAATTGTGSGEGTAGGETVVEETTGGATTAAAAAAPTAEDGSSPSSSPRLADDPFVQALLQDGAEAEEVLRLLLDQSELLGGGVAGDGGTEGASDDDDASAGTPWSLVRDGDTQTWVRREEGARLNSLKMRGVVDSPLINLLALFLETDLYHMWMTKELKEVQLVAQLAMFKRITYFRAGFGWGVWDRDIHLHTFGVDLAPRRAVLVVVNECDAARAGRHGVELPPAPERTVRVRGKPGGMLLEYVSESQTKLTILSRSDPQLNAAAYWVLDFVQKHVSHAVVTKLGTLSRALEGTPYEQRVQDDRDGVYRTIRERLDALLQADGQVEED